MKKIEIIIAPEQLGAFQQLVESLSVKEVAFSQIMKYQSGEGAQKKYRGACYQTKMLQQVKAELWCEREDWEKIKQAIAETDLKDCKCFIYEMEEG